MQNLIIRLSVFALFSLVTACGSEDGNTSGESVGTTAESSTPLPLTRAEFEFSQIPVGQPVTRFPHPFIGAVSGRIYMNTTEGQFNLARVFETKTMERRGFGTNTFVIGETRLEGGSTGAIVCQASRLQLDGRPQNKLVLMCMEDRDDAFSLHGTSSLLDVELVNGLDRAATNGRLIELCYVASSGATNCSFLHWNAAAKAFQPAGFGMANHLGRTYSIAMHPTEQIVVGSHVRKDEAAAGNSFVQRPFYCKVGVDTAIPTELSIPDGAATGVAEGVTSWPGSESQSVVGSIMLKQSNWQLGQCWLLRDDIETARRALKPLKGYDGSSALGVVCQGRRVIVVGSSINGSPQDAGYERVPTVWVLDRDAPFSAEPVETIDVRSRSKGLPPSERVQLLTKPVIAAGKLVMLAQSATGGWFHVHWPILPVD